MKRIFQLFIACVLIASAAPAMALKLDFGGEIRFRYEQSDNTDFNDATADYKTVVYQLSRFNIRFSIDKQTTAFLSLQDSRKWGESGGVLSTADEKESTDLGEAWLQVKNVVGPINMRVGRQRLKYGNQRLVSEAPWNNHGKRFDALKVFISNEILDLDVFFSKTDTSMDTSSDSNVDDHFNGIYASLKKVIPAAAWDFYIFQKKVNDKTSAVYGQDIFTAGTLINGKAASFDWSAEYAEQFGTHKKDASGDNIKQKARFYVLTAGYTFESLFNMRLGTQWLGGSGDKKDTDDNEAFDTLFSRDHFQYGMTDVATQGVKESEMPRNTRAFNFNVSLKPFKKIKLKASYWNFQKEINADKYGSELNFQVLYALTPSTNLYAYYATYTPAEDTGDDQFKRAIVQVHSKF